MTSILFEGFFFAAFCRPAAMFIPSSPSVARTAVVGTVGPLVNPRLPRRRGRRHELQAATKNHIFRIHHYNISNNLLEAAQLMRQSTQQVVTTCDTNRSSDWHASPPPRFIGFRQEMLLCSAPSQPSIIVLLPSQNAWKVALYRDP